LEDHIKNNFSDYYNENLENKHNIDTIGTIPHSTQGYYSSLISYKLKKENDKINKILNEKTFEYLSTEKHFLLNKLNDEKEESVKTINYIYDELIQFFNGINNNDYLKDQIYESINEKHVKYSNLYNNLTTYQDIF